MIDYRYYFDILFYPDKISHTEQEDVKIKLTQIIEKLRNCFPNASETVDAFSTLSSFNKIINEEVKQFAERILKQDSVKETTSMNRDLEIKDRSVIREYKDDVKQTTASKNEDSIDQNPSTEIKQELKILTGALQGMNVGVKMKPKIQDPIVNESHDAMVIASPNPWNWNNLLQKNARSIDDEDLGRVVRIGGSEITIIGSYNRIYTIPKNMVQQVTNEVVLTVSLREMNYFDTAIEPRKFYGKNIALNKLANSIHEYLNQNKFETQFFDDHTSTESRFHIQAIKGGKFRTITTRRQRVDIIIIGNPSNFLVKVLIGESLFEAAEKMQSFVHLGGFEKDIWNYIKKSVDQLTDMT